MSHSTTTPPTDGVTNNGKMQAKCTIEDAPAIAKRGGDGIWTWTVIDCPYCHRRHHHGGGVDDTPERLGYRVAHCVAGGSAVYSMVEVSP